MKDIDPNTKTLESGNYGIIIEGEYKGTAFIKDKNGVREIPYESLPNDFIKVYTEKYN